SRTVLVSAHEQGRAQVVASRGRRLRGGTRRDGAGWGTTAVEEHGARRVHRRAGHPRAEGLRGLVRTMPCGGPAGWDRTGGGGRFLRNSLRGLERAGHGEDAALDATGGAR